MACGSEALPPGTASLPGSPVRSKSPLARYVASFLFAMAPPEDEYQLGLAADVERPMPLSVPDRNLGCPVRFSVEEPKLEDIPVERQIIALVAVVLASVPAFAEDANSRSESAPPSSHSTGRSVSPETKGEQQPQGPTGPIDTGSGGAPAESPQGQQPPSMEAAPEGSSKTIVDPSVKK